MYAFCMSDVISSVFRNMYDIIISILITVMPHLVTPQAVSQCTCRGAVGSTMLGSSQAASLWVCPPISSAASTR